MPKRIYIRESQFNVLLENEGTNMKRARRYLEAQGYDPEQRQKILDSIRTDIPNSRLQQCKFLLGVTRMYIEGELNDGRSIAQLNKVLKYVASDAHVNEYDYNLNGESVDTLVQRFGGVAKADLEQSRAESDARTFTVNNAYKIVPIDSPEEAAKYGKYTSWCVTHDEDMYNSYTADGTGRFYFCLRNGFQKEPNVEGEGCPLDSYGLSMIAVSITMEGELNTVTCRWNHDNGGNDNIMTLEQLEQLIGRNFYQTFKPYSREELHDKGVILFDEVQGLLDSGEEPENIFDVFDEDREGFALVGLNDKYNFINEKRQLLSGKWFDYAMYFSEGLAAVELNEKWNFIDTNGNFLLDKWVDGVESFKEGFAVIKVNDKANYINTNGQLLSSQWFDDVVEFSEGFGAVILNNKHNFINKEGRLLSKTWFDCSVFYFSGGFAAVELNRRWNFINTKGEFLSDQWWQSVRNFKEGFAAVYLNGKWNFIDTNGKLLSNEWFNYANDFDDGIATVRMLNGTFVNIDRQGRIYRNVSESIDERGTNLSSLYHFTDVMGLEGIMRSGVFNLSSSQRDIRNGKNYFSFTRHKSPLEGFAVPNRCTVRVEVNPDVINSIHDKSIDSFEYYSPSNAKVNPYCNIWSNIYSDNGDNSAKAGYRVFKASAVDAYDEEDAEYGNQAEEHLTSDKMQINAEKAIKRIDIYVDTDNNYCTAHKEKIYNTFLGIFRMKNSPLYDKIFIYDNKRDFSLQTNNCVPMREYSIKKLMMDLGVGGAKLSVAESRNRNKILKTSGNMKKVFITEQQLKYILNESVKKVFKEGQFDFLDDDEFKWSNDYSAYVVVDDSCDAITGNYDNVQDAINDAKESARSGGSYSVFGCVNDVYDDNTLVYCTSGDRNSYKF